MHKKCYRPAADWQCFIYSPTPILLENTKILLKIRIEIKMKRWVNHDFWVSHALKRPRHSDLMTWRGFPTSWDEGKHGRISDKIPRQSDALLIWSWRIGQWSQMISLTPILLTLMWHERFTGWWSDLWMSRRCTPLDFVFVRGFGFGWDTLWSLHFNYAFFYYTLPGLDEIWYMWVYFLGKSFSRHQRCKSALISVCLYMCNASRFVHVRVKERMFYSCDHVISELILDSSSPLIHFSVQKTLAPGATSLLRKTAFQSTSMFFTRAPPVSPSSLIRCGKVRGHLVYMYHIIFANVFFLLRYVALHSLLL